MSEELARDLTHAVMRHYGYTDEQIEVAEDHLAHEVFGCQFDGNHMRWDCEDEAGNSRHPDHDELARTANLMVDVVVPIVEREIRRGQHDLAAKVDEAFLALARDLWREAGRAEQRKSHTEAVNLRYAANRISRRLADARAVIIVEVLDCNDDAEEFRRLQNEVVDRLSDLAREDNMRLHLGIDKTADAVMDAFPPQYTLPRDEQEG